MKHIWKVIILVLIWIMLSGHWETHILILGVISIAITVAFAIYFNAFDKEIVQTKFLLGMILYLPYIIKEMLLANFGVFKEVWKVKIDLSPTVKTVKSTQKTTTGAFIYANSITFTPGTTTIDAQVGTFQIYAITSDGAKDLEDGSMDARVTKIHKDI